MNPILKDLHKVYLDYTNNFASVQACAEHYGISEELMKAIICEFN